MKTKDLINYDIEIVRYSSFPHDYYFRGSKYMIGLMLHTKLTFAVCVIKIA